MPFECVAASIERAREHWFSTGDLIEPVLASCALPGMFPPVRIGDEHFFDGGLVNSIPLRCGRMFGTVWDHSLCAMANDLRAYKRLVAPRLPP